MKKIIIVLFLFVVIFLSLNERKEYIIPDSAIRFRVIANSNTLKDQAIKMEIKNNIENMLEDDIRVSNKKEQAESVINNKLPNIKNMIDNYNIPYTINFGKNYFPEKSYKNVLYKEGEYESLVVTLGKGNGNNFWCVLFPPLCLVDKDDTKSDKEYSFFVKEVFENFM